MYYSAHAHKAGGVAAIVCRCVARRTRRSPPAATVHCRFKFFQVLFSLNFNGVYHQFIQTLLLRDQYILKTSLAHFSSHHIETMSTKFNENFEKATIILLDIAGTTTSISFLKVGDFKMKLCFYTSHFIR